jgi:23S rRNA pseudouridine2605 synthase
MSGKDKQPRKAEPGQGGKPKGGRQQAADGEAPAAPKRSRRRGPRKPGGENGNVQAAPRPQAADGEAPARKRAPRRRRRPGGAKPAAGGGEA